MKNHFLNNRNFTFLTLLFGLLLLNSCSVSKNTTNSKGASKNANLLEPNDDESDTASWSSLFRRVPGLDVRGTDSDLTFVIRGAKSLQGRNDPLIVLDGVALGNDFSSLSSSILPKDVGSIRVLKGASASLYGVRGAYGVIVVKSKEL